MKLQLKLVLRLKLKLNLKLNLKVGLRLKYKLKLKLRLKFKLKLTQNKLHSYVQSLSSCHLLGRCRNASKSGVVLMYYIASYNGREPIEGTDNVN